MMMDAHMKANGKTTNIQVKASLHVRIRNTKVNLRKEK